MILYGVTVTVDTNCAEEWLNWMQTKHIPDVLATNLFDSYKIMRLINPAPEPGSITFSIQYFLPNLSHFNTYQTKYAPSLQAEHTTKFGGKALAFRTLLEVIG